MKLSKRETFMVIALVFIVMIASFWFLFLSPARILLAATQSEYDSIKASDDANQAIINNVAGLADTQTALKGNIADIENSLLPALENEVITEHFANIFGKNGLHYITLISCDPVASEQLLLTDGAYSENSVQWVRVNMKISGTDGVTDGGVPAVGYKEFITAVKEIEAVNPDAIHVSSISMQDTKQGFQYFMISVDVFAFNLPHRIAAIDTSEPYITWGRDPAPAGGMFGIPYADIASSQISASFFKPFATVHATNNTPVSTVPENTVTPVPTP